MTSTPDHPLSVSKAMRNRRAIKHFDPHHQMPEALFQELMEQTTLTPSVFNIQHWRFVRIRDTELRKAIRAAAWDQPQVTDASELLVLSMDLKAWQKEPARYWADAPSDVQAFILPAMDDYYRDKPQVERDEAMRSGGLVAMSLMLIAQELGYDTCPMDGFDYARVGELIRLPKDHTLCMMIAIGKRIGEEWPRPRRLPFAEIVVEDRF